MKAQVISQEIGDPSTNTRSRPRFASGSGNPPFENKNYYKKNEIFSGCCEWCGKSLMRTRRWQRFCEPKHRRVFEQVAREVGASFLRGETVEVLEKKIVGLRGRFQHEEPR